MENTRILTSLQGLKSKIVEPLYVNREERIARIIKILVRDKVVQNQECIEEIKKSLEILSEESLTIVFEMYTEADIAKLKNKIL